MIEDLIIIPTEKTPGIDLSYGILLFHGRSIIKDTKTFFDPVHAWIKKYLKDPAELTSLTIKLEYIDSQSAQALFQIITQLQSLTNKDLVLLINWFYAYGDLEMLELGEVIQGRLGVAMTYNEFMPEDPGDDY